MATPNQQAAPHPHALSPPAIEAAAGIDADSGCDAADTANTAGARAGTASLSQDDSRVCYVRPEDMRLREGTAVVIEGLVHAPEWNGKRGLLLSFDAEKGRYQVAVKGRKKALGLRPGCCVLEAFTTQPEYVEQVGLITEGEISTADKDAK